jgi:hypothetical protein
LLEKIVIPGGILTNRLLFTPFFALMAVFLPEYLKIDFHDFNIVTIYNLCGKLYNLIILIIKEINFRSK